MFVFSLAVFALCAFSTFAKPLLGSLPGSKSDVHPKDGPLPRLTGRDVNDAGMTELPTCHRDDLYELFSDPDHNFAASAFCSVYIAFSSLDRATVTPTYTATVNVTATRAITTTPIATSTTAPSATCSFQNATDDGAAEGGATEDGATEDDATEDGTAEDGAAEDGAAEDGAAEDGAAEDGAAEDGAAEDGATEDGAAEDGAAEDGAAEDGAAEDGAAEDGVADNGATTVPSQLKRQALPLPPAEAETYPALRLSSVCSCLVVPSTIVTTFTETASAEVVTEMSTIQVTAGAPQTQNTTAIPPSSISQARNSTARITTTVSRSPFSTSMATGATLQGPNGTATATGSTSLSANTTARTTAGISSPSEDTSNATGTSAQTQNGTTTTGFSSPTNTSNSSALAAYCDQTFIRGNGTFLARYTVKCHYSYSNLTPMRVESQPSYGACVRECDNDSRCYGFSYLLLGDGENCYIYNYYPLPAGHPDDLFDSGSYVVGSNNGMKH